MILHELISNAFAPMRLLLVFLLTYVFPALIAYGGLLFNSLDIEAPRNGIIMHGALLASIGATQYAIAAAGNGVFPWRASPLSLAALGASTLGVVFLLGLAGFLYAASSFIQELTIGSAVFLLSPSFPVYSLVLLVVPPFVACHFLSRTQWKVRLAVIASWGTASVLLFRAIEDPYVLAAVHSILGALLIRMGILYSAPRRGAILLTSGQIEDAKQK